MSKTIRKIPWAVPGLAMVAVAAFLAIGLLATNGAAACGCRRLLRTAQWISLWQAPSIALALRLVVYKAIRRQLSSRELIPPPTITR